MTDGKVHLYDGKVLIENGVVALCDEDCCGYPRQSCAACSRIGDNAPGAWQVDIADIVNGACTCTSFNDSWICDVWGIMSGYVWEHLESDYPYDTCIWEYSARPYTFCGDAVNWYLEITLQFAVQGGVTVVEVDLYIWKVGFSTEYYWNCVWKKTYGELIDCLTVSNENIPFYTSIGDYPDRCDDSAPPTCALTAL